jgi:hypothetical protein
LGDSSICRGGITNAAKRESSAGETMNITNLYLGSKVTSTVTGNTGIINKIWSDNVMVRCQAHDEYHSPLIRIEWEKGNISVQTTCDLDWIK